MVNSLKGDNETVGFCDYTGEGYSKNFMKAQVKWVR